MTPKDELELWACYLCEARTIKELRTRFWMSKAGVYHRLGQIRTAGYQLERAKPGTGAVTYQLKGE